MGIWSWIGVAALSWGMFSFAFAVMVGRAIRLSDQSLRQPATATSQRPNRRSGFRMAGDGAAMDTDDSASSSNSAASSSNSAASSSMGGA